MKHIYIAVMAAALFFSSCKKDDDVVAPEYDGQTTLTFDATVNGADFALDKDFTIGSNTYQFTQLRYWVSNVVLVNAAGAEYMVPESYYLLEETKAVPVQDGAYEYPATKREDIALKNIPAGDYKAIKFSIGVEQKYNDNLSLQAGELSQLNGMTNVSWMWHTSYIFSALGGTVKSGADAEAIQVETGLNANYKSASINFPETIRISSAKTTTAIKLSVDVAKIIDGIDLVVNPTIGAAQAELMAKVAENYVSKAITVSAVVK